MGKGIRNITNSKTALWLADNPGRLASRIPLAATLGLLLAVMSVPVCVGGVAFLNSEARQIQFSASEAHGVEVLGPALHVLADVAATGSVATDLADLESAVARNPQLEAGDQWSSVLVASRGTDAVAEADALVALITQVGNTSNLILDPDLDSYYLMDMLVTRFPNVLAQAVAGYEVRGGAPESDKVTTQQVAQIALANNFQLAAAAVNANIETATDASAVDLTSALAPATNFANTLTRASQNLIAGIDKPKPFDFNDEAHSAAEAIDPAVAALDNLLAARVSEMESGRNTSSVAIAVASAIGVAWTVIVSLNINRAVGLIHAAVGALAVRDLRKFPGPRGTNELAQVGRNLDQARAQLGNAIHQVGVLATKVAAASNQMSQASQGVDGHAQETLERSGAAARDLGEVQGILSAVSGASSEMSHATLEISSTMAQVNTAAQVARNEIDTAEALASEFGSSLEKIGESVTAIVAVADKTRLLALNATIEAARAGEAGRGFAVVASEVQALARQSADASNAIGAVAEDQQREIQGVLAALERAAAAVASAADSQATVAAATEQQTATISQVSASIAESAVAVVRVAHQVSAVESTANDTASTASELLDVANNVTGAAGDLVTSMSGFRS